MRAVAIGIVLSGLIIFSHEMYVVHMNAKCSATLPPATIEKRDDGTVAVIGNFHQSVVRSITMMASTPREIVLINSPGGYIDAARALAKLNMPIRASGVRCDSACSMILTDFDNVCFDETIEAIVFHSFIRTYCAHGEVVRHVIKDETEMYINGLPSPLRDKLQPLIERERLVSVSAEEFRIYFPDKQCEHNT